MNLNICFVVFLQRRRLIIFTAKIFEFANGYVTLLQLFSGRNIDQAANWAFSFTSCKPDIRMFISILKREKPIDAVGTFTTWIYHYQFLVTNVIVIHNLANGK